jgi:hypothetical protein
MCQNRNPAVGSGRLVHLSGAERGSEIAAQGASNAFGVTLGYHLVVLTGLQFRSLRSHGLLTTKLDSFDCAEGGKAIVLV